MFAPTNFDMDPRAPFNIRPVANGWQLVDNVALAVIDTFPTRKDAWVAKVAITRQMANG